MTPHCNTWCNSLPPLSVRRWKVLYWVRDKRSTGGGAVVHTVIVRVGVNKQYALASTVARKGTLPKSPQYPAMGKKVAKMQHT
jgi:hypothetical protein